MTKRESVAATSSGEHQAATAQVALPVHARGTRGWVRIPTRTVTPRTVTSAPGTVTMHNRVLSCAADVGKVREDLLDALDVPADAREMYLRQRTAYEQARRRQRPPNT
jgi:hypothetical protein